MILDIFWLNVGVCWLVSRKEGMRLFSVFLVSSFWLCLLFDYIWEVFLILLFWSILRVNFIFWLYIGKVMVLLWVIIFMCVINEFIIGVVGVDNEVFLIGWVLSVCFGIIGVCFII